MAIYAVAYDLNKRDQDYPGLWSKLLALDSIRAQKSLWYVNTPSSVFDLRTYLDECIDGNDTLHVSQMFKGCYGLLDMQTAADWLAARGL